MSFDPDVPGNAGETPKVRNDLRQALRELDVRATEDGSGTLRADYTPGSYDPVPVAFSFPQGFGVVAIEGELAPFQGDPTDDLRQALNFLNVEVDTYRFYASEGAVRVRHDLLPNLEGGPAVHPRELRQALTGLCAQKAIFADVLGAVQKGRPWKAVKDALKAFR